MSHSFGCHPHLTGRCSASRRTLGASHRDARRLPEVEPRETSGKRVESRNRPRQGVADPHPRPHPVRIRAITSSELTANLPGRALLRIHLPQVSRGTASDRRGVRDPLTRPSWGDRRPGASLTDCYAVRNEFDSKKSQFERQGLSRTLDLRLPSGNPRGLRRPVKPTHLTRDGDAPVRSDPPTSHRLRTARPRFLVVEGPATAAETCALLT